MRLLHQLARDTNKAILISTHELDLALQVADQIWLMDSEGHLEAGLPEELILNGAFQQAFNKDGISFDAATGAFHIHTVSRENLSFTGDSIAAFWTRKALTRMGYQMTLEAEAARKIIVDSAGTQTRWIIQDKAGTASSYDTLTEFLKAI